MVEASAPLSSLGAAARAEMGHARVSSPPGVCSSARFVPNSMHTVSALPAVEGVPAPAVSPDADAATQDAAADVAGDGASPDAAAGGVGDTGGDQTTTGEAQP